jgi:hypothetical protein
VCYQSDLQLRGLKEFTRLLSSYFPFWTEYTLRFEYFDMFVRADYAKPILCLQTRPQVTYRNGLQIWRVAANIRISWGRRRQCCRISITRAGMKRSWGRRQRCRISVTRAGMKRSWGRRQRCRISVTKAGMKRSWGRRQRCRISVTRAGMKRSWGRRQRCRISVTRAGMKRSWGRRRQCWRLTVYIYIVQILKILRSKNTAVLPTGNFCMRVWWSLISGCASECWTLTQWTCGCGEYHLVALLTMLLLSQL